MTLNSIAKIYRAGELNTPNGRIAPVTERTMFLAFETVALNIHARCANCQKPARC